MGKHKSVELHPFCLFTVQSGKKEYLHDKMQVFAENLAKTLHTVHILSLRKVQISISITKCILRRNKSMRLPQKWGKVEKKLINRYLFQYYR